MQFWNISGRGFDSHRLHYFPLILAGFFSLGCLGLDPLKPRDPIRLVL